MDSQTQAQIYLAHRRGTTENAVLRSFHTFNFGAYQAEGREPFGALCLLNDDTLSAGARLTMQAEWPTTALLLPIMGGLEYQTGTADSDFLVPGQVGILSVAAGDTYTISNPYETESINCLQLWLTNATPLAPLSSQNTFDLSQPNTLLPVFHDGAGNQLFIGRYAGRQDGTYQLANTANGLFVLVVQGVFEVANRLLQVKDGLSLLGLQHGLVEFEALSDDAILWLVEVASL